MELEPITRTEQFLSRAAGGDGVELQPVTRTEHFLQKIIDSGGGGGGPYVPLPVTETITSSTPTITPVDNHIYQCGELTSLTISNPPASGAWSVVFTSGSTATTTTIPSTILGLEDFAAEANTIYEINVLDNRAVIGSWAVSA